MRIRSFLLSTLLLACSGSADPALSSSPGGSSEQPSPSPTAPPSPPASPPSLPSSAALYFPTATEWQTVTAAEAGFDQAKLDEVATFVEQSRSTTFIVLRGGKILVEKYWNGATQTTLRDIASVQKSISSLLVGIANANGKVGLDDTLTSILGAGWSNATPAEEAPITVRHILTMTSGLNGSLGYAAPAGSTWLYNTDGYHRIDRIIEKIGGEASLQAFTRKYLFDPIGVGSSTWDTRPFQKDSKGAPINALDMNARDMARVGLLVQSGGLWEKTSIVPSTYVTTALTPSQAMNPSYGFLFWLNGQSSARLPPSTVVEGMLMPSAPPDVVAGLGASDQKIYVSRSANLVVIRQGQSAGEAAGALSNWDDQLWQRIMAAKTK